MKKVVLLAVAAAMLFAMAAPAFAADPYISDDLKPGEVCQPVKVTIKVHPTLSVWTLSHSWTSEANPDPTMIGASPFANIDYLCLNPITNRWYSHLFYFDVSSNMPFWKKVCWSELKTDDAIPSLQMDPATGLPVKDQAGNYVYHPVITRDTIGFDQLSLEEELPPYSGNWVERPATVVGDRECWWSPVYGLTGETVDGVDFNGEVWNDVPVADPEEHGRIENFRFNIKDIVFCNSAGYYSGTMELCAYQN